MMGRLVPVRSFALVALLVVAANPLVNAKTATARTSWPLGTFTVESGHPRCLTGYTCTQFAISGCSNVSAVAEGVVAEAAPPPSQPVRGLVALFSGEEGSTWWSAAPSASRFLSKLRSRDGFVVVQVKWLDSWLQAPRGEDDGSAHLGCRPATAIDWIHQDLYVPLGITPGPGQCGFCVTGNSGGASQVSYALSHYGLDGILNGVFPTSGPPHAAQVKGCLPGSPGYLYEGSEVERIDLSYGFDDNHGDRGPCMLSDPSWTPRWQVESIDTGANDTSYPSTRIEFVIGADDTSSAVAHARDFRDLLEQDGSNDVTWTVVQGMGHSIQVSSSGLAALEAPLLGTST